MFTFFLFVLCLTLNYLLPSTNAFPGRAWGASAERSDEDDRRAAQAHPHEPESHPRRGDVRGDQQGLRGMGRWCFRCHVEQV